MTRLAAAEVAALDPYKFMATIGKTVIHPGGRASTQALLARARITASSKVLDVGCGVATTAIEIARRFGAQVTAVDIAPLMLERAAANVRTAKMTGRVTVRPGDICALPFAEDSFEVVIAEAVTMFADRPRAAGELARVCAPGGQVLATEFCWRTPPPPEARQVFLGQVCPGMVFDTIDDWVQIYSPRHLATRRRTAPGHPCRAGQDRGSRPAAVLPVRPLEDSVVLAWSAPVTLGWPARGWFHSARRSRCRRSAPWSSLASPVCRPARLRGGRADADLGCSWGRPPADGVRRGGIDPEPGPQRAQVGGRSCQLAIHLPRQRSQGSGVASLVRREQAAIQAVDVSHPSSPFSVCRQRS